MTLEPHTMEVSAEEGARIVALGRLAEATKAAEALRAEAGEEPLHDFRVALRRLRSTLRTYRPWLSDGVRPRHERRLKAIARSTNAPRDAEVQLAALGSMRDALSPPRRRPGWELMLARYEAKAGEGAKPARAAAELTRAAAKLARRLGTYERRVEDRGPGATFGAVVASLVADHSDVLAEGVAAIRDAADQERVHSARIEGKRLRYLLEPLRGFRGADASEAVVHLKALQDVLGDLHDAHVLAEALHDALVESSGDRARRVHDALLGVGAGGSSMRAALRGSPRPGLVALAVLTRERRDALFAEVEREWRGGGRLDALRAELSSLTGALEARAGGRIEHERKFLLAALPPAANDADDADAVEIAQGWLPGVRLRERIRRIRGPAGERFLRGVKRGAGDTRLETEEETTREVFDALWPLTEGRRVTKRRYRIREGAAVWEIDRFTDRELIVAEVELPARETEVAIPEWLRPLIIREVTGDPAYLNERLAEAHDGSDGDGRGRGAPEAAPDAPAAESPAPDSQAPDGGSAGTSPPA